MKRKKSPLTVVKGLIINWKDRSKDLDKAEIFDHNTSHRNPIYRLMSKDIFDKVHSLIVNKRRLFWKIEVDVVFDYPNGTQQRSGGEFEAWCTFSEVAPACVQIHQEGLREGNIEHYKYTEFTATCLKVA